MAQLSGSTTKKVVLDRFDREPVRGFINPQTFLQPAGIELISPEGSAGTVPVQQVKSISFVRELTGASALGERRQFLARPKTAGLWVELHFRDGDRLEGVMNNNLLVIEPWGYALTPPEAAGNAQRVLVPRQALKQVVVLGVVGGKRRKASPQQELQQFRLFGEE